MAALAAAISIARFDVMIVAPRSWRWRYFFTAFGAEPELARHALAVASGRVRFTWGPPTPPSIEGLDRSLRFAVG
ncbi:hypothetical protein [Nannocystis radixulma]|uniref:Uncharacterized protein n=1 Tax=Nannocystis radixulma TaxID=2995305 RepID=A0ABT5AYY3_9BACT|nr:hypothetical protein [Nannocystis radixulma]MDC0667050.1 hypothetical protein [Nannocystis radixulma]